jgi:hypothetical protein
VILLIQVGLEVKMALFTNQYNNGAGIVKLPGFRTEQGNEMLKNLFDHATTMLQASPAQNVESQHTAVRPGHR